MIDKDGYRPNVGIVICNAENQVFWAKRTQEHAILKGTGDYNSLHLEYAPDSMDIKQGDILESSGMGQYYPAGYPVAVVTDAAAVVVVVEDY